MQSSTAERVFLQGFVAKLDAETTCNRDWWFTNYGNPSLLFYQLHPEADGDVGAARFFWARTLGAADAAKVEQLPYLRGFVEGALAELEQEHRR